MNFFKYFRGIVISLILLLHLLKKVIMIFGQFFKILRLRDDLSSQEVNDNMLSYSWI